MEGRAGVVRPLAFDDQNRAVGANGFDGAFQNRQLMASLAEPLKAFLG